MVSFVHFAVIALAVMGAYVVRVLDDVGYFAEHSRHGWDHCEYIQGGVGNGDMAVSDRTGLLYISSDDLRSWKDNPATLLPTAPQGAINAYDLKTKKLHALQLKGRDSSVAFHPHGLHVYSPADRSQPERLFVINHARHGVELVEIYEIVAPPKVASVNPEDEPEPIIRAQLEEKALIETTFPVLRLLTTVNDPLLYNVNALHPMSPRSFFLTSGGPHPLFSYWELAEQAFPMLSSGSVLFCSGDSSERYSCSVATDRVKKATGIGSIDDRTFYVSSAVSRYMEEFVLAGAEGVDFNLTHVRSIPLPPHSHCYNIKDNQHGALASDSLTVACHLDFFDFMHHIRDRLHPCHTHILQFNPKTGNLKDIVATEGTFVPGATVALFHKDDDHLYMGSVFAKGFLQCKVPSFKRA